jgi:crotonobetainyl-CoA:carnitine CoA-transferase CaiB-like acyl-CoA transferase
VTAPLDKCFVIDVTEGAQGPFAATLLADLGATVLKVERPGGELMRRGVGPRKRGVPVPMLSISRGRVASLALDLKSADGKARLLDLVGTADVFIENWRPGTAARLGLAREDLHAVHPGLVYLSASGFGGSGPFARFGSMDSIAAASGALSSVSGARGGRSERYRLALLDFVSGMVTGEMALAALLRRELSGAGGWAETSQLESAAAVTGSLINEPDGGVPIGSSDRWAVPSCMVATADGVPVALHVDDDVRWQALVDTLGVPGPAGWSEVAGRRADRERVEEAVADVAAGLTADELLARLGTAGVPGARVHRSLGAAMDDTALSDTHVVWRRSHVGWVAMARPPWRFADFAVRAGRTCPPLNTATVPGWQEEWGKHDER